jgi:peptide/nickel transport system ATP-binding protein
VPDILTTARADLAADLAGTAPLFTIEDLRLSLPDLTRKPLLGPAPRLEILKGLTFAIPRGEILGIVGGSGSGKTTLGRALLRLLDPTGGRILFDGQEITRSRESDLRPFRRRAQMIFQDPMSSLNPRHRVRALIGGPLTLHALDRIDARVDEALDQVGLPRHFRDRYPHELSGGQRQRVGIARAIALRPDFILADEIVSGLDVSSQAQVLNLLERLVQDLGLTLAFISHDLGVIRRLCTRTLVLHRGEIVENAPTDQLFAAPQSDTTRDLLDAIPLPDPDQPWT